MVWRRKKGAAGIAEGAAAAKQVDVSVTNSDATGTRAEIAAGRDLPLNSDKPLNSHGRFELGFKPLPASFGSQRRYSIPRSYRISGSLISARPISVHGEVPAGQLSAQLITVMPGGRIAGQARADTVQVAGVVSGHIRAKSLVDVSSLGEVSGAVETPQLRVVPGAKLVGASLKVG